MTGRSQSDRRFRITLWATVGALALACVAFAGLGALQGPKLSSTQVDPARVVAADNQQLRMFTNQPVSQLEDSQVTVSPAARFSVSAQNDIIALTFAERLDYDTEYTVTVSDVTSIYLDRPSTLSHSFTTAAGALTYLDRADPATGGRDAIIRTGVTGSDREVLYEADGIQDFVVLDELVAVVTLGEGADAAGVPGSDIGALTLVSLADGATESLALPFDGSIGGLGVTDGGFLGFTMTSPLADAQPTVFQALYTVNLPGSHTVQPVLGLDGEQIEVAQWLPLPGGTSAVALRTDEALLSVDLSGETPPTPLGRYTDLSNVSLDGSQLVVGDIFGALALSIESGDENRLEAAPVDGQQPAGGAIELLGNGPERVQQLAVLDAASGRFESYLVFDDGVETRVLYESPSGTASIEGFSVSPNGQFVAVTVTPDVASSVSDGYAVGAMSTTVSTIVIDVDSGAISRSVDGFAVSW